MIARLDRWLLAPAPAERLAALRILIGGFVVVYLVANVGEFDRVANRDAVEFEPVGLVGLLSSPLASWMVWLLFVAAVLSGIAAVMGFQFRLSGPAFAVFTLFWASYHSSWGQMLHFEHLFTLHLMILSVSPAADAWSFDDKRAEVPNPTTRYGWPIRLMALATAITYVIAGIAKLRIGGLAWIDGSTLQNHIGYSATRLKLLGGFEPPLAEFVIGQDWLLAPMALAALLVELFAPIALFGSRLRRIWVATALCFHIGTAATMMVWFPYQGLGFAFLAFFHPEKAATPSFRFRCR